MRVKHYGYFLIALKIISPLPKAVAIHLFFLFYWDDFVWALVVEVDSFVISSKRVQIFGGKLNIC